MKPFHFKNFSISQSKNVFRVGTDGVLLGALSSVDGSRNILEVGTGTGLISLMIAQRNPTARITALDLNADAVILATENFKNSPFQDRMSAAQHDFKTYVTDEKFDLIVSNPPYFEENASGKDIVARQQTELSFSNLIQKSAGLLCDKGTFSVIIPFESGDHFEKMSIASGLFPFRKIKIFGIKNSAPKRWILEFSRIPQHCEEIDFIIEQLPRKYTDEYLELTKDFHVFAT